MDDVEAASPIPPQKRLRTVAIIVYATFALLVLAIPDAISSRLDDLNPSPLVRAAQAAVGAVAQVSNTLGIAPVYRAARSRFLAATGLQQD
jgi:membrane protein YdbS with pleckstrin-like domain